MVHGFERQATRGMVQTPGKARSKSAHPGGRRKPVREIRAKKKNGAIRAPLLTIMRSVQVRRSFMESSFSATSTMRILRSMAILRMAL